MTVYSISPNLTALHRQHAKQWHIASFRQMYDDIKDKTNPDKSELLKLLDQYNIAPPKYGEIYEQAIKLKLQARWIEDEQNIMVKTMSQDQLHKLEHPFWLKNASLREIVEKLCIEDDNKILEFLV